MMEHRTQSHIDLSANCKIIVAVLTFSELAKEKPADASEM